MRDSYADLFGFVPPLPAAKFEFSADIAPEALHLVEQLRAHAFYSDVFNTKTTQLLLFGMLRSQGSISALQGGREIAIEIGTTTQ